MPRWAALAVRSKAVATVAQLHEPREGESAAGESVADSVAASEPPHRPRARTAAPGDRVTPAVPGADVLLTAAAADRLWHPPLAVYWPLGAAPATVVAVDADGDLRLCNADGIVSGWTPARYWAHAEGATHAEVGDPCRGYDEPPQWHALSGCYVQAVRELRNPDTGEAKEAKRIICPKCHPQAFAACGGRPRPRPPPRRALTRAPRPASFPGLREPAGAPKERGVRVWRRREKKTAETQGPKGKETGLQLGIWKMIRKWNPYKTPLERRVVLNATNSAAVHRAFLDQSGTQGLFNLRQFVQFMHRYGLSDAHYVAHLWQVLNRDGDDTVSIDEFIAEVRAQLESPVRSGFVKACFRLFDSQGNFLIRRNDLLQMRPDKSKLITAEQLDRMRYLFNSQPDVQEISYAVFCLWMSEDPILLSTFVGVLMSMVAAPLRDARPAGEAATEGGAAPGTAAAAPAAAGDAAGAISAADAAEVRLAVSSESEDQGQGGRRVKRKVKRPAP
eukprot:TRINITY_DN3090_c0_g1_i2.p1 TRINITY_DN3090_c0_g1~~TRINITY_DN3090_c0_g1_i2.p1  ORF type:complete len:531 (+),score=126.04 TRINITY_DN3090_c0_g1_i2:82-1593(+)